MRISQNGREIMEGSGLLDIMQESDMITSGSVVVLVVVPGLNTPRITPVQV